MVQPTSERPDGYWLDERAEIVGYDYVRDAHIKDMCSLCNRFFLRKFKIYTDLKVKFGGEIREYKRIPLPAENSRCPDCKEAPLLSFQKCPAKPFQ